MSSYMSNPLLYAAFGLIVGILVGLTGVGGGSVMTPILMLVFGQSPAVAVGTDLDVLREYEARRHGLIWL